MTYFFRNIKNIGELEKLSNDRKIKNEKYVIVRTILLEDNEFDIFVNSLNKNQPFLYEYINEMSIDNNGIWKCILVKSKNKSILVQNDGYSYCKFTALE